MIVHCYHHLCSQIKEALHAEMVSMVSWNKIFCAVLLEPYQVKLELHCQQLRPQENLRPPFGKQVCVHANIECRLQKYRETMS